MRLSLFFPELVARFLGYSSSRPAADIFFIFAQIYYFRAYSRYRDLSLRPRKKAENFRLSAPDVACFLKTLAAQRINTLRYHFVTAST